MIWLTALVALASATREAREARTFTSPSGRYALHVSPLDRGDRGWNGAAELALTRDGVELWRARHELGLRDALVSDDGSAAGFGYTGEGPRESPPPRPPADWPLGGTLHVFAFAPDGTLVLDETEERRASPLAYGEAEPVVHGEFLVPELGRFVVRVEDEDGEQWRGYDLAAGAALFRVRPALELKAPAQFRRVADARAVPGTPLVLVHWWYPLRSDKGYALGGAFQLVDPQWNVIWTLTKPGDYDGLSDREWIPFREHGAVLGTANASFSLRFVAKAQRVTFAVRREGESWSVTEVGRTRYEAGE